MEQMKSSDEVEDFLDHLFLPKEGDVYAVKVAGTYPKFRDTPGSPEFKLTGLAKLKVSMYTYGTEEGIEEFKSRGLLHLVIENGMHRDESICIHKSLVEPY